MEINVDNLPRLFSCQVCNKKLSSYKSLWRHTKNFHNEVVLDCTVNVLDCTGNVLAQKNKECIKHNCKYCNKIYKSRQNKWDHEKICKTKIDELAKSKEELRKIKDELKKTKFELTKTNKTINSNNNNCNNTTNNNNGVINNITINSFGKENLSILGPSEIKKLIKNDNPLIDIIGLLNFNENFPENHSFCNTSLEGNYVSVLNTDKNKVEKINKNEFYDKVLNNSFNKIDELSLMLELDDSLKETLKDKYKKHLDKKIDHIKDIFFTDKVYKNCYKTNINEMSYNKKNLVLGTWSKLKESNDDDGISTLETDESLESDNENKLESDNEKYVGIR
jgi:hypothetical protein